jgi:hypothetical protein
LVIFTCDYLLAGRIRPDDDRDHDGGQLPVDEAVQVQIAKNVAEALAYAHPHAEELRQRVPN